MCDDRVVRFGRAVVARSRRVVVCDLVGRVRTVASRLVGRICAAVDADGRANHARQPPTGRDEERDHADQNDGELHPCA